jgi:hypothetical protein
MILSLAMTSLDNEIAAFDAMRPVLEAEHRGEWVLFNGGQLVSCFKTFESAAGEAVRRFGRGPYLIRQVGAAAVTLPASIRYGLVNGPKQLRVP